MRLKTLLAIAIAVCCCTQITAQEFRLDHFKFYKFDADNVLEATIQLKGQFDRDPVKTLIRGPALFANPVSKDGGILMNKDAHFTAYFIVNGEEPTRDVSFTNQFGDQQRAVIGRAELLLVPAAKSYERASHPVSDNLDHFKCYRVEKYEADNREVTLEDQFTREENIAVDAEYFCVPVEKTHNDKTNRIQNERDHLVIYELKYHPSTPTRKIGTSDQFGKTPGETYTVMWLGVPTLKHPFEERDK